MGNQPSRHAGNPEHPDGGGGAERHPSSLASATTEHPASPSATDGGVGHRGGRHHHHNHIHRHHTSCWPTGQAQQQDKPPDEFIDGGFLVPINHLYSQTEAYSARAVKTFIRDRRLAPFYKSRSESDGIREGPGPPTFALEPGSSDGLQGASSPGNSFTMPQFSAASSQPKPTTVHPTTQVESKTHLANRTPSSLSKEQIEVQVNRIAEALISHFGPVECPICFLYYPSNINRSRCCDQPICTECFIQIKRPDTANQPASCPYCVEPNFGIIYTPPPIQYRSSVVLTRRGTLQRQDGGKRSIRQTGLSGPSSVATCIPTGNHGRRDGLEYQETENSSLGLSISVPTYTSSGPISGTSAAASSPTNQDRTDTVSHSTPLLSDINEGGIGHSERESTSTSAMTARRKSVSHKASNVVTSDEIRPDYVRRLQQEHLQNLHEQQASRARYLALAAAAANVAAAGSSGGNGSAAHGGPAAALLGAATALHLGSRDSSSRRNRRSRRDQPERQYFTAIRNLIGPDLEELMIMEAVRQSLIEDGERQRQQESAEPSSPAAEGGAEVVPASGGNNSCTIPSDQAEQAVPSKANETPAPERGVDTPETSTASSSRAALSQERNVTRAPS